MGSRLRGKLDGLRVQIGLLAATLPLLLSWGAGLAGCSSAQLDIETPSVMGLKADRGLTPQQVIHALGRPDEETRTQRWLWRTPRLYLKYYGKGLEFAFDSEGRTYDPVTARLFNVYVFLTPADRYRAFEGRVSKDVRGGWELSRLEKALGPPQQTRETGDEIEWIYGAEKPYQLVFIAEAAPRKVKALMIIRRERDRPRE